MLFIKSNAGTLINVDYIVEILKDFVIYNKKSGSIKVYLVYANLNNNQRRILFRSEIEQEADRKLKEFEKLLVIET